jgi:predicted ATP-dependent serine protease
MLTIKPMLIVNGSPGIGKSTCILSWLFYQASHKNLSFLYIHSFDSVDFQLLSNQGKSNCEEEKEEKGISLLLLRLLKFRMFLIIFPTRTNHWEVMM